MRERFFLILKFAGPGVILVLAGLLCGCHGADDTAPTNTKNSQYMGNGQTAADKIGADRAHSRLPHHGNAPN